MRMIHRVSIPDEAGHRDLLSSLGIAFNTPKSPLVRSLWFDIDEAHPAWVQIQQLIAKWNAGDIVQTRFTSKEVDEAHYLQISPAWHHGYPQPEDAFGYLNETYDLSDYCPTCGIGKKQRAPFRMKGEPKWGKKHVLQVNWVFDEFFVLPQVWEEVFKPIGVGSFPVVEHRTGEELRTVVQLDIKDVAKSALAITECVSETCGGCHRKKYVPISRGFFPPFTAEPSSKFCKTQEYFGSGASAWRATVAANEVYRAIQVGNLAGLTFTPMSKV